MLIELLAGIALGVFSGLCLLYVHKLSADARERNQKLLDDIRKREQTWWEE